MKSNFIVKSTFVALLFCSLLLPEVSHAGRMSPRLKDKRINRIIKHVSNDPSVIQCNNTVDALGQLLDRQEETCNNSDAGGPAKEYADMDQLLINSPGMTSNGQADALCRKYGGTLENCNKVINIAQEKYCAKLINADQKINEAKAKCKAVKEEVVEKCDDANEQKKKFDKGVEKSGDYGFASARKYVLENAAAYDAALKYLGSPSCSKLKERHYRGI